MKEIRFDVPGVPVGKQRPKVTVRGHFAHAYTPDKTVNYEALVKMMCDMEMKHSGIEPLTGEIHMIISAFYPIPNSCTKKSKREIADGKKRPVVKPDIDNIAKIICDALNGIAYIDDNHIVDLSIGKFFSENNPHVNVFLYEGCKCPC